MKNEKLKMLLGGGIIGLLAVILVKLGNPGNMGICVACFWRDVAGGLGLHRAEIVQYIRPEILGFVFGSFLVSVFTKDFRVRGGSAPVLRFVMGMFMMIGALAFLGCPLRMILRLSNGDLNAIVGLAGFVVGILLGIFFLKRGFTLGRNQKQTKFAGYVMPLICVALLAFLIAQPEFIFFSKEGPGSKHAPMLISLAAGVVTGIILQRTRICTAGAFRDIFLIKDAHYLWGVIGLFVAALVGNLAFGGSFKLGFTEQPVAHNMHIWNFLGMTLVGLTGILLGGCPIRQTVLSGEGDTDAAVTVLGLIVGAAFCHNFGLAASPKGIGPNGQIAVIIGLVFCCLVGFMASSRGGER